MTNPQAFIFLGRSGSGKGTQADLLIDLLKQRDDRKVIHIETGQMLREFAANKDTYTSNLVQQFLDEGKLIPDYLTVYMWGQQLNEGFTGEEHIVCDGTPRKLIEAKILNIAFEFLGFESAHSIYLNVSREWSMERLLARGRSDDNEEDINARLDWFGTDVLPIVEFHKDEEFNDFHNINGEQTIEEVHAEILEKLNLSELQ